MPKKWKPHQMCAEQCRAARGWLDWSQAALAQHAGVSLSTVRDFEKGRRVLMAQNLGAICRTLEAAGVKFLHEPDGLPCGVVVTGR